MSFDDDDAIEAAVLNDDIDDDELDELDDDGLDDDWVDIEVETCWRCNEPYCSACIGTIVCHACSGDGCPNDPRLKVSEGL